MSLGDDSPLMSRSFYALHLRLLLERHQIGHLSLFSSLSWASGEVCECEHRHFDCGLIAQVEI